MFQSVWNVAAAFCVHEKKSISQQTTEQSVTHFGHHALAKNHLQQHATSEQASPLQNVIASDQQDHSDHLPSFSPILLDAEKQAIAPIYGEYVAIARFYWLNLYQSPDLSVNQPPPVFAPLLVG